MTFLPSLTKIIAIAWSSFQLYTAYAGFLPGMVQLPIHLSFALALSLCLFPMLKGRAKGSISIVNLCLIVLSLSTSLYVLLNEERITTRTAFVDEVMALDIFFGLSLVLLLLEVSRRTMGISLTIITLVFLAYGFLGPYIPGILGHGGIPFHRFIDLQLLSEGGIFGLPLGVSAEVVFYFILFGAFLEKSGGGHLFMDIAYALTGRLRGGAAKASVISSALFGTISGSAVANVVVTGTFTIPLMKKTGYSPRFASTVEAVASTGGQIMPPIMGAAAFIMAQILGIPYAQIIITAAIPAVLYYVSLYTVVDLQARREGIQPIPRNDLPNVKEGLKKRAHLLVPLVILIWSILSGYSVTTSAFWAILAIVAISYLRRATWMSGLTILKALETGAKEAIMVAIPCAIAGIIIGVVINSGLGLKFTSILIFFGKDQLLLTLILTMIGCLILGMGMPTSAAYIIAAILLAPPLIKIGFPAISAHMFVFYFAVISMITPPVALASFAAAAIGGAKIWETGSKAFQISLSAFLIPYAFMYNEALLAKSSPLEIIWVTGTAFFGVRAMAAAVVGFWKRPATIMERVLLGAASILLITPEKITDLLGGGLFLLVFLLQTKNNPKRQKKVGAVTEASGDRPKSRGVM